MADRKLPINFDSIEEYYEWKVKQGKPSPKGYIGKTEKKPNTRKKNVQTTKQGVK